MVKKLDRIKLANRFIEESNKHVGKVIAYHKETLEILKVFDVDRNEENNDIEAVVWAIAEFDAKDRPGITFVEKKMDKVPEK